MKKTALLILALSLLLTACGAEAMQPDPEAAPQIDLISPTEPEPLTNIEAEKPEISQEALESIFETVYASAVDTHPEDWNVEFQITDEVGKITAAIPEDVNAPADLRTIYTEWRNVQAVEPVETLTFTDCNETVYATSEVNIRSGPGAENEKLGSLSWSDSITRTGIGTGDYSSWSRVQLSDGTVAYIASNYLSTTKPVASQPAATPSKNTNTGSSSGGSNNSGGSTNSGGGSTTTPAPSTNTDTGSSGSSTANNAKTKYPAGTTYTAYGDTYTSTGETIYNANWMVFQNSSGSQIAVCIDGTISPLRTDLNIDLSDGGEKYADGMTTSGLGTGSFYG